MRRRQPHRHSSSESPKVRASRLAQSRTRWAPAPSRPRWRHLPTPAPPPVAASAAARADRRQAPLDTSTNSPASGSSARSAPAARHGSRRHEVVDLVNAWPRYQTGEALHQLDRAQRHLLSPAGERPLQRQHQVAVVFAREPAVGHRRPERGAGQALEGMGCVRGNRLPPRANTRRFACRSEGTLNFDAPERVRCFMSAPGGSLSIGGSPWACSTH